MFLRTLLDDTYDAAIKLQKPDRDLALRMRLANAAPDALRYLHVLVGYVEARAENDGRAPTATAEAARSLLARIYQVELP